MYLQWKYSISPKNGPQSIDICDLWSLYLLVMSFKIRKKNGKADPLCNQYLHNLFNQKKVRAIFETEYFFNLLLKNRVLG